MSKYTQLFLASLLMGSSLATPALAKGLSFGPHKIGGEVELQTEHHSNVGAAPSSSGTKFDDNDDDDIDREDLDDAFGEDMIDDALEEFDLDEEELLEFANDGDEDNDGTDDALDSNLPASRKDSAWRTVLSGQVKHAYEFSKSVTLKSAFKVAGQKNTDRDDLDKVNYAITSGPVFKLPHNLQLQPSVTFMSVDKDAGRATDTWIGSLAGEWKATKQWAFGARYNYQDRDVVPNAGTDALVDTFKVEATYKPTKRDQIKLGFSPSFEDASRSNKDKDKYGFNVAYQHSFSQGIKVGGGVKYGYNDNVNLDRQDNDTVYDVGAQKEFDNGVYVGASLAYKARSSNIDVKSNHDKAIILNTGWKF